jgi:hypothetical protein
MMATPAYVSLTCEAVRLRTTARLLVAIQR